MFTVAHHHDGEEHFHAADIVVYHGPWATSGVGEYSIEIVQPTHTFYLTGGQAYVMNDRGSTVAKYDLGSPSDPSSQKAAAGIAAPKPPGSPIAG